MGDYNLKIIKNFLEDIKNKNFYVLVENNTESVCAATLIISVLKQLEIKFTLNFTNEFVIENSKNYLLINKNEIKTCFNNVEEKIEVCEGKNSALTAYLIAKESCKENIELIYLALSSNEDLIDEAISNKIIETKQGFSILGSMTREITRAVELAIDPYIPGLTNEENVMDFLSSCTISTKQNDKTRTILDLNEEEVERLHKGICTRNPNAVNLKFYNENYFIVREDENNPLKDFNEFKLFLEACVVLGRPSMVVGKCLSPKLYKNRTVGIVKQYRMEILELLDWFYLHKNTNKVIENDNTVVIKTEKEINEKVLELIYKNFYFGMEKAIISVMKTGYIYVYYKFYNSGYNIQQVKERIGDLLTENGQFAINNKIYDNGKLLKFKTEKEQEAMDIILKCLETAKVEQVVN